MKRLIVLLLILSGLAASAQTYPCYIPTGSYPVCNPVIQDYELYNIYDMEYRVFQRLDSLSINNKIDSIYFIGNHFVSDTETHDSLHTTITALNLANLQLARIYAGIANLKVLAVSTNDSLEYLRQITDSLQNLTRIRDSIGITNIRLKKGFDSLLFASGRNKIGSLRKIADTLQRTNNLIEALIRKTNASDSVIITNANKSYMTFSITDSTPKPTIDTIYFTNTPYNNFYITDISISTVANNSDTIIGVVTPIVVELGTYLDNLWINRYVTYIDAPSLIYTRNFQTPLKVGRNQKIRFRLNGATSGQHSAHVVNITGYFATW
jgi:hypothetical protein